MPIGQRTLVLLPLAMVLLFRLRLTVLRVIVVTAIAIIGAGLLLPLFKWQYSTNRIDVTNNMRSTLSNDMSRTDITADVIARCPSWGTEIMPFPLAGYAYSALFYVPRKLAPFKGRSTSVQYTAAVAGSIPEETNWGFGVGAIEEVILNAGVACAIPGLLAYGICMGLLERLSRRYSTLRLPFRLATIWSCGYHLPAIILTFGTMGVLCLICEIAFCDNRVPDIAARKVDLNSITVGLSSRNGRSRLRPR